MKNKYLMLSIPLLALAVVGCNNGSTSSSSSAQYLPAGTYTLNTVFDEASFSSGDCGDESTSTEPVIIQDNGNLCATDDTECAPFNLNANPCYSYSETESGATATLSFSNCVASESNTVVNGNFGIDVSYMGEYLGSCTGTYNLVADSQ